MKDQDLASLSLQEFREFLMNPECDLEMIRATLTDKMNFILDEKTVIENQLNAAKARYQLGQERSDPEWFSKATGALNHRKRKIDKLNKMLSFLNNVKSYRANKLMEVGVEIDSTNGYEPIKEDLLNHFFEKVFCDICKEELEENTFNKIKEMTKEVIEILRPKSFGEYTDFRSWRQKYINEHKSNYDYKQMASIYSKANCSKV